ncbi:hypothetical protein ACFSR7_06090 [Cohnella sp. GCM10020058]|uniref:hypothetical protein n=1 Tax=Cohnella sp. GCM10020058 TaxID=3317330 RepID=UPI003636E63E
MMGTLRRYFKDMAILLENAAETGNMDRVKELAQDLNTVQETMAGGKRWAHVEETQPLLLALTRGKVAAIEQEVVNARSNQTDPAADEAE